MNEPTSEVYQDEPAPALCSACLKRKGWQCANYHTDVADNGRNSCSGFVADSDADTTSPDWPGYGRCNGHHVLAALEGRGDG